MRKRLFSIRNEEQVCCTSPATRTEQSKTKELNLVPRASAGEYLARSYAFVWEDSVLCELDFLEAKLSTATIVQYRVQREKITTVSAVLHLTIATRSTQDSPSEELVAPRPKKNHLNIF